ncbi:hypothetical protein Bca101_076802 [Brassica carinata]
MAPRHFTAAEKGKGLASQADITLCKRVRAPTFDTSALIRDNALTLIGRVTNPREQPISSLISSLPRKWNLKGQVVGSDLGQLCFQFRFDLEEDLVQVLHDRPFHYNHWMLILQRWEPVISPLFPSQIPFWIKLHGLPLHFWHEKMIYNIRQNLGTLDDYKITKTSARICVSIDGLKPLVKSALVEFDIGEELPITLDYEDLGYHCSACNSLSHLACTCPTARRQLSLSPPPQALPSRSQNKDLPWTAKASQLPKDQPFNRRIDRHGRPFGDRIPLPEARGRPLQNKITPSFYRPVPPMQDTRKHRFQRSRSPVRQWREKTQSHDEPLEARAGISKTPPCADPLEDSVTSRPPLERNLELTDYPHLPRIPLREEVMEDLREVTFQYTNVTDPIEAAAKLQKVIRSEEEGLMKETTSRIIAAAANNLRQCEDRDRALPEEETRVQSTPMARAGTGRTLNHTPRSTRNARERSGASRRTQASPRIFAGTNLRRRNIAQSASKHGFPHAAPIHSSQGRAHIPTSTEPALPHFLFPFPMVSSSKFSSVFSREVLDGPAQAKEEEDDGLAVGSGTS